MLQRFQFAHLHVAAKCTEGKIKHQFVNDESYLSDERDDSLGAVLVHVWKIDLITEQHQPLAQLDRGEDHTVGGTAVLAVMIEGLQQQLWGGGTGEVQTHHLAENRKNIWKLLNIILTLHSNIHFKCIQELSGQMNGCKRTTSYYPLK